MKRFVLFSLLLALAGLIFGFAAIGDSNEEMVQAAKALDAKFIAAYNAKDVDAIMECYWNSPDLVSFSPGAMEQKGWEAVKASFTQEFAEMAGGKLEIIEAKYMVEGDVVLSLGKWRFTMPAPEGEPMVMEGRYSDAKAKRDGKLVVIMDHASVPMPPPEMTEAH